MNRRKILEVMIAACMAPAVVRAGAIMRINPKIIAPELAVHQLGRRLTDEELNALLAGAIP